MSRECLLIQKTEINNIMIPSCTTSCAPQQRLKHLDILSVSKWIHMDFVRSSATTTKWELFPATFGFISKHIVDWRKIQHSSRWESLVGNTPHGSQDTCHMVTVNTVTWLVVCMRVGHCEPCLLKYLGIWNCLTCLHELGLNQIDVNVIRVVSLIAPNVQEFYQVRLF